MPTLTPRIQVTFRKPTLALLNDMARSKQESVSQIVVELVELAVDLASDISLAEFSSERVKTFRRDDALTSEELKKRLADRKRKKK